MSPNRRKWVIGTIGFAIALAVLVPKPARLLVARSTCEQQSGDWNAAEQHCDYGPGGEVVRLLERSAQCRTEPESGLRLCDYSAGSAHITIVAVGTTSASIAIDGADEQLGYSVSVFMNEGCVRVAPGASLKQDEPERLIEDGFISTWTGEVYDSMTMCWVAGREFLAARTSTAFEEATERDALRRLASEVRRGDAGPEIEEQLEQLLIRSLEKSEKPRRPGSPPATDWNWNVQ